MIYFICMTVFISVFIISCVIFSKLDFFKTKNNIYEYVDWGKIVGFALIPAYGFTTLSWIIYNLSVKKHNKTYSKFLFDGNDTYSNNIDNSMSTRHWSKGNYSCGM